MRFVPKFLCLLITGCLFTMAGMVDTKTPGESDPPSRQAISVQVASNILDRFGSPDADARVMFRWWFPDAASGADDDDSVAEQVRAMYDAGFGGVEVAMVVDNTDMDNEDARLYGWGTPNWINLMKKVLRAARALPGDFKVDFTITAHWPPSLNTIDPNDDAASSEMTFAYRKITGVGTMDLPMPSIKTNDDHRREPADFIFTDRFVAATIAKIAAVEEGSIVLEQGSMKDISGSTSFTRVPGTDEPFFTPAGIPENSTAFGNKARLADRQYYYQTDIGVADIGNQYHPSQGGELKAGDWILFGFYSRGTGAVMSGGSSFPMADRMYETNYFNKAGTQAIVDYWNSYILADPELLDLLREVGGDLFEDSIESSSEGPFWTNTMLEDFMAYRNYDITRYLPLIAKKRASNFPVPQPAGEQGPEGMPGMPGMQGMPGMPSPPGQGGEEMPSFGGPPRAQVPDTIPVFVSDEGFESRFMDDYLETLSSLYYDNHIKGIQNWSHDFNYGYRAQAYGGPSDTDDAGVILDVDEGDCLGNEALRRHAGNVHMAGKKFISEEALGLFFQTYLLTWKDAADLLNTNYASGSNRVVAHGAAYEKSFDLFHSEWPGWHPFDRAFSDPMTSRMPYWSEMHQLADYLDRSQAILQNGLPKTDVVVYQGSTEFVELLDNGYSYDIIGALALQLPSALVTNGTLNETGPAYKAILVNDQPSVPFETAEKLVEFAREGLPVIVYGHIPSQVTGMSGDKIPGPVHKDSEIQEMMKQLLSYPGTKHITDRSELVSALQALGIEPSAQYSRKGLRYVRKADEDGSNYYWLYNGSDSEVEIPVSFVGEGIPYLLDLWDGTRVPMAAYVTGSGRIRATIRLEKGETQVFLIASSAELPSPQNIHVISSEAEPEYRNGTLVLRSKKAGTFNTQLSDGNSVQTEITNVAEPMEIKNWELQIESWGPGEDENKPTVPKKTMIDIGQTLLVPWSDLAVPDELLDHAGVSDMEEMAGIGTYTAEITLPEGWAKDCGAYLKLATGGYDMITEVEINGTILPPISQITNTIDTGGTLRSGLNTIRVELTTTLNNRVRVENALFRQNKPVDYGLVSVTLIPFGQVEIEL